MIDASASNVITLPMYYNILLRIDSITTGYLQTCFMLTHYVVLKHNLTLNLYSIIILLLYELMMLHVGTSFFASVNREW